MDWQPGEGFRKPPNARKQARREGEKGVRPSAALQLRALAMPAVEHKLMGFVVLSSINYKTTGETNKNHHIFSVRNRSKLKMRGNDIYILAYWKPKGAATSHNS